MTPEERLAVNAEVHREAMLILRRIELAVDDPNPANAVFRIKHILRDLRPRLEEM